MKMIKEERRQIVLSHMSEIRFAPNGTMMCVLYAANDDTRYEVWGEERITKHIPNLVNLLIGTPVSIIGRFETRRYHDKDYEWFNISDWSIVAE